MAILAAGLAVPLGVWILSQLEVLTIRWIVTGVVALTLLAVMTGWRWHGRLVGQALFDPGYEKTYRVVAYGVVTLALVSGLPLLD